jgi:hypothetical protein
MRNAVRGRGFNVHGEDAVSFKLQRHAKVGGWHLRCASHVALDILTPALPRAAYVKKGVVMRRASFVCSQNETVVLRAARTR